VSRRNAQEEAYVVGAYNGDDVLIAGSADRNRASTPGGFCLGNLAAGRIAPG